jgi:hypothetical protein
VKNFWDPWVASFIGQAFGVVIQNSLLPRKAKNVDWQR